MSFAKLHFQVHFQGSSLSGITHMQGIIQEFNLGIGSHIVMQAAGGFFFFLGGGGGGGAREPPPVTPLPILVYITSRFAYMKHLFC